MKNLFKRIVAFHRENKQYDGFFQMECFACITALLLVMNIIRLSTDPVDWMFLMMEMVITSFYIERWIGNKKLKEFADFTKEIHDLDSNFTKSIIDQCEKEHARLVAANRRRKRAELALKKCRKRFRCVRTVRMEYEMKCSEYEDTLLTAYTATYDYSVKAKVSEEDIAHAKEARIRFNEYMGKHYEEMARNKFWREYKQDVFD